MADVGDVDPEAKAPPGQRLDADGVVEVARRLAVDGDRDELAQVLATGEGRRGRIGRPRRGLGADRRRMLLGDLEVAQGHQHVDPRLGELSEVLDHPAARPRRQRSRRLRELGYDVAPGAPPLGLGQLDLETDAGVEGLEPAVAAGVVDAADEAPAPGQHRHHRGLGQVMRRAAAPPLARLNQHPVAVTRLLQAPAGDEEGRLRLSPGAATKRPHHRVPATDALHPPRPPRGVLEQDPAPVALDHLARRRQLDERPADLGGGAPEPAVAEELALGQTGPARRRQTVADGGGEGALVARSAD